MKNTIVALVYDFDETLSTTYMQDYVLIPELGMSPKTFLEKGQPVVGRQLRRPDYGQHVLFYEDRQRKRR